MIKRILGLLLFIWMACAFVGAVPETFHLGGTRLLTHLVILGVCILLGTAGLILVFRKRPPTKIAKPED